MAVVVDVGEGDLVLPVPEDPQLPGGRRAQQVREEQRVAWRPPSPSPQTPPLIPETRMRFQKRRLLEKGAGALDSIPVSGFKLTVSQVGKHNPRGGPEKPMSSLESRVSGVPGNKQEFSPSKNGGECPVLGWAGQSLPYRPTEH